MQFLKHISFIEVLWTLLEILCIRSESNFSRVQNISLECLIRNLIKLENQSIFKKQYADSKQKFFFLLILSFNCLLTVKTHLNGDDVRSC